MKKAHDRTRARVYAGPDLSASRLSWTIGLRDGWTEHRSDEGSVWWFDERRRAMVCVAVVDDEPAIVEIVDQVLAEHGWDVLQCRDGRMAAAVIQQEQPDVILLEVWLRTVHTGWSVLHELQQDPRTSTIPVIVYSGAVDQLRAQKEWLDEHGIAVLMKPFDLDDLDHRVRAALANKIPTPARFQAGVTPL